MPGDDIPLKVSFTEVARSMHRGRNMARNAKIQMQEEAIRSQHAALHHMMELEAFQRNTTRSVEAMAKAHESKVEHRQSAYQHLERVVELKKMKDAKEISELLSAGASFG